jgi:cell fate regulator YaaT (PSP1 superfamily)
MGCGGCSTGRGCSTTPGTPSGCKNNGSCGTGGCNKLNVFDWLANMELPGGQAPFDIIEVRFKNSRKEFFRNVNNLQINTGEAVAVEASPGHDMGTVSMSGELVRLQLKKKGQDPASTEIKKLYRKARQSDIDKWKEAQGLESTTMYKARTIAVRLGLHMKISDVEYQGDKTKAIFYYTAEERVDFRELIKILAEEFKVRIEMKQIGARQEASRLGGIGSCGRELCCSTWLTDFRSVTTGAARYQQLSLNPLKLAGQCGKLKCCLNYELDSYLDALKDFPETDTKLETLKGTPFHQKTDIFRRLIYYSFRDEPDVFIAVPVARVKEIIAMNKEGQKPDTLVIFKEPLFVQKEPDFENVVGQDSLTRFDKKKGPRNNNKKKRKPQPADTAAGGVNRPAQAQPRRQSPVQGQAGNTVPAQNRQPRQPQPNRPPQQNKPSQSNRPPQQNKPPQQNRPQQQNRPSQQRPGRPPRREDKPGNAPQGREDKPVPPPQEGA